MSTAQDCAALIEALEADPRMTPELLAEVAGKKYALQRLGANRRTVAGGDLVAMAECLEELRGGGGA